MKLEEKFQGLVAIELFYTYKRERVQTIFYVELHNKSLFVFDENNDLKWKCSYMDNEDNYAITNVWCKSHDKWSISDDTKYAKRIHIHKILDSFDFSKFADSLDYNCAQ